MNHNKLGRKFMSENIIRKIKSRFFNYIRYIIRENSNYKKICLHIFQCISANSNSDRNKKLFNMKIKDIFLEEPKGTLYSHLKKDYNKKIIEKIYKEGKEIKVIQILELTFKELFIIFRNKLNVKGDEEEIKNIKKKIKGLDLLNDNTNYPDIKYCLDVLRRISGNDQEEKEKYINKIKNHCCNYEILIGDKMKRRKKKKNKSSS